MPFRALEMELLSFAAANKRHSSGTPLSPRIPRSLNESPEPATRSFTVHDASTSPGHRMSPENHRPRCSLRDRDDAA